MSRRKQQHDVKAAAAQAAQLVQRLTCEGCAHLRGLRPKCDSELSAHYRTPRETYSERCAWFAVRGQQPRPVQAEPPPASRAAIAGEVAKRKHNRWERRA
jgi:hypothetical protein